VKLGDRWMGGYPRQDDDGLIAPKVITVLLLIIFGAAIGWKSG